ncbi:MAG TPA: four helix bundle protein [Blastocatellia bacterium]|nr:four helix bundle protein [Blastocatellia bacterium]
MGSQSYRDLIVWQRGIELSILVYEVCSTFPRSELYGLTDQMKRAVVSISSNIAEGRARHHIAEFRQFLSISNASLAELETQRIVAERMGLSHRRGALSWTSVSPRSGKRSTLFAQN